MKKFFLRSLAVIGSIAILFAAWVGIEVALLVLADTDYDQGDYAAAMEKWQFLSDYAISSQADSKIGKLYLEGKGVDQDHAEATRWFARAADDHDLEGIYLLGRQYLLGQGIAQDNAEAARLIGLAAEYDHAQAQFDIGSMYFLGTGVAEDRLEGEKWLTRAVANGDYHIRYERGAFYMLGMWKSIPEGGIYDPVEAYKWLLLAVVVGDQEADAELSELDQVLGADEIDEANRRAVEWMKENVEVD